MTITIATETLSTDGIIVEVNVRLNCQPAAEVKAADGDLATTWRPCDAALLRPVYDPDGWSELPSKDSCLRIHYTAVVTAIVAASLVAGCAARPRQRPLPTTRIESGPETVEAARRALQGRWSLVSLEVAARDGRRATIAASGLLNSDSFGNMSIEYQVSPEGLKALASVGIDTPNPVIATSGTVAINPQERSITFVPSDAAQRAFDPELAARRNNPFALERSRYYSLGEDAILTLATRYDDGKDAATSRWKKN
jgi:hypothetical protein